MIQQFVQYQPIDTPRLLLRPVVPADVDDYFRIHANPETNRFNPAGAMTERTVAEAIVQQIVLAWESKGFDNWSVLEKKNPECIIGFGGLSLKKYGETERLNLGYRFSPSVWGKGYATELACASVEFGLQVLRQEAVFGLVRPDHIASIRVLEKCGMIRWGDLDDVPNERPSLIYCIKNHKTYN